jgi:DNA repair protein RadC
MHPDVRKAMMLNEIAPFYVREPRKTADLPVVIGTQHIAQILQNHYAELLVSRIEYFSVVFLNRSNRPVHFYLVSQGGMSGTVADPRVILQMALMVGACGMVLCHNHPSGSLRPSIQDRELTLKIKEAAKLHDIIVLDHIILSDQGYFSFADEGLL